MTPGAHANHLIEKINKYIYGYINLNLQCVIFSSLSISSDIRKQEHRVIRNDMLNKLQT